MRRLGRLDDETLLSAWADIIADMSTTELSIESSDAILAGRLLWEHKDPPEPPTPPTAMVSH
jgi:hypothetical protein